MCPEPYPKLSNCLPPAVVELYVELLLQRVAIVERAKDAPPDMREAISSLFYAAERVTDLPVGLRQSKTNLRRCRLDLSTSSACRFDVR